MQAYKILNYERSHGSGSFAPFRHLNDAETGTLRAALGIQLGLAKDVSVNNLTTIVNVKSSLVEGANAEDNDFDLLRVLNQLALKTSAFAYLNWYHFDDVDEIRTNDLVKCFGDIWYSSTDDLDIVDPQLRWVLSVFHWGGIKVLRID